ALNDDAKRTAAVFAACRPDPRPALIPFIVGTTLTSYSIQGGYHEIDSSGDGCGTLNRERKCSDYDDVWLDATICVRGGPDHAGHQHIPNIRCSYRTSGSSKSQRARDGPTGALHYGRRRVRCLVANIQTRGSARQRIQLVDFSAL